MQVSNSGELLTHKLSSQVQNNDSKLTNDPDLTAALLPIQLMLTALLVMDYSPCMADRRTWHDTSSGTLNRTQPFRQMFVILSDTTQVHARLWVQHGNGTLQAVPCRDMEQGVVARRLQVRPFVSHHHQCCCFHLHVCFDPAQRA